ncbi:hypothetical protein TNIN_406491 [Trichonephila inaurata madagascariensis]|uniref:Uncharacterized protein n=1 Tax=Trichonephila inaurata madagascariensis TaxID=2747483 RepID=A0A8X6WRT9_9ARAC|nr:hypothetical protein TNIN_406491 [Trichonephila inaurata madagascariensis]
MHLRRLSRLARFGHEVWSVRVGFFPIGKVMDSLESRFLSPFRSYFFFLLFPQSRFDCLPWSSWDDTEHARSMDGGGKCVLGEEWLRIRSVRSTRLRCWKSLN